MERRAFANTLHFALGKRKLLLCAQRHRYDHFRRRRFTLPGCSAAAALERLEHQEEEAHRRLVAAIERGNPVEVDAAQAFWLKCSETLRRLDLAIEVSRRSEEEQLPKKVAQDAVTATAEWLRIAFVQFLSSEAMSLMGISEVGEWKH